jgi:demethylmenaquinone methyltransferase/2-methoxy-6-polyprenyl-1,4-benzoquinol methylase
MKTEDLGNSKILNLFFKPAGSLMGSRLRTCLRNPVNTLKIADIQPGQTILEVGCGTGFFTIEYRAGHNEWAKLTHSV